MRLPPGVLGVLFTGDAANARGGRANPPWLVEDSAAAVESYRALMALAPAVVCCGHGDPVRRGT